MSRHVLASLSAALALFSALPAWSAEPAALLFVVEQQRASMVARLAQQWGPAFDALTASRHRSHEDLANTLWTLRADRPSPRSPASSTPSKPSLPTPRRTFMPSRHAASRSRPSVMPTPISPTPRSSPAASSTPAPAAAVPLAPSITRTFNGFAAGFSTQGGTASNCAIPNGVAALAMNVYAVNPTNLGFIKVWPANATEPAVSTVNYQVGITAIATGGGGGVTSITAGTGLTGGTITTTGTLAADTAYLQRRVNGSCAPGSSIRTINADGTVAARDRRHRHRSRQRLRPGRQCLRHHRHPRHLRQQRDRNQGQMAPE